MPSEEHEDVVALVRSMRRDEASGPEPVEDARERLEALGDGFEVPPGVEVALVDVGGVPAERCTPPGGDVGATVLYLHGGAYVAGSPRSHRSLCGRLALAAGVAVVSVAYRLAPEHAHPAGLDDAVAAYRGLLAQGHDPAQVVVAGDSAGGGLATALLLALRREATAPPPAGAVLLSPWLDLTLTSDAVTARADAEPMLRASTLAVDARAYAGDDLRDPLVSPVFADAADLAALPPLLVLVGTAEILLDDSRTFAERARAAGASVELDVGEGLMHVWPFLAGVPEAEAAMARIASWVRDRTGLGPG